MRRGLAFVAVVAILAGGPAAAVRADEPAAPRQPAPDTAQQLAEQFAPIFMLKQQSEDCDPDGEPYRPGLIDIVLDNPQVALRQLGNDDGFVAAANSYFEQAKSAETVTTFRSTVRSIESGSTPGTSRCTTKLSSRR